MLGQGWWGVAASIMRWPSVYDVNCIDVRIRQFGLVYLLGHLEAEAAAVLFQYFADM